MPSSSARRNFSAGRVTAVILLVVAIVVGVVYHYTHEPLGPVPSFDAPIGALDAKQVPDGLAPDVEAAAKNAGIPAPVLAAQLEAESHWNPQAKSKSGAEGLAQFTPDAWKTFGEGDPYNPHDAIAAQGRLLKWLKKRAVNSGIAENETKLVLAGYNAGFENVVKYKGVPPFGETQGYLTKIARRMGHYALPLPSPSPSASGSATAPASSSK